MSNYRYEGYGVVRDLRDDFPYHTDDIVELLDEKDQQIVNLEAKLAESEKQIKDAREAGDMAVDSWCKNRRKYEAQIAEMQNKSFILYSMLYETLEKQGCEDIASQIDQMTGWTYDKEADWFKGNRNYDQLKQQLTEKEQEHELLIDQFEEETEKLRKQIKQESDARKRFVEANKQLKHQLSEKNELLRQKIVDMKSTDFIKMCVESGFMVQAKEIDNQIAIAELEKAEKVIEKYVNNIDDMNDCLYAIDQQIKQLKEVK